MSDSTRPAEDLATEILDNNSDISPLFEDVVEQIKKLRACGLTDETIRDTVPGMYEIKEKAVEKGQLEEPAPEEIQVISLPEKYQRTDWS